MSEYNSSKKYVETVLIWIARVKGDGEDGRNALNCYGKHFSIYVVEDWKPRG